MVKSKDPGKAVLVTRVLQFLSKKLKLTVGDRYNSSEGHEFYEISKPRSYWFLSKCCRLIFEYTHFVFFITSERCLHSLVGSVHWHVSSLIYVFLWEHVCFVWLDLFFHSSCGSFCASWFPELQLTLVEVWIDTP